MIEVVETPDYKAFVAKFRHTLTTDDCYTPPAIYEAVQGWVSEEYGIDPARMVRPFYPGGDYESYDYSNGAVVVDNPPFSIFKKICKFYLERDIPFFLFAPAMTAMSAKGLATKLCHIVVGRKITYANGVVINTGFVTNLEQDTVLRTAPKLYERLRSAELAGERKVAPLYEYPKNVLTVAMMDCWSRRGIHFRVKRGECTELHTLDAQKAEGKKLFGGGYLLSDEAAARKVAAQAENEARKERIVWHLSEREKELVRELNGKEN